MACTGLYIPSGSSSIAIGTPITGGGANNVLYEGSSGVLAQSSNFQFNSGVLSVPSLAMGISNASLLGFYGTTPVVQPSGDVATALSNLGLITSPTIIPKGSFSAVGDGGTFTFTTSVPSGYTDAIVWIKSGGTVSSYPILMNVSVSGTTLSVSLLDAVSQTGIGYTLTLGYILLK